MNTPTARESHAYILRALGVPDAKIARKLNVTLGTVKSYASKVQAALTAQGVRVMGPNAPKQTTDSSSPFEALKQLAKEAGLKR